MQVKLLFSRWTKVAGLLLIAGALAWVIKLSVIVSTNGRIIDTGAAALFMKIGLLLLAIGSTGIGHRLSLNRALFVRIIATVVSPIVVFGFLVLIGSFITPLFSGSPVWYAPQEAPIAIGVIFYLVIGFFLYKSYKPAER